MRSEVVHVEHPVPCRFVRPRARTTTLGVAKGVTPVELRHASGVRRIGFAHEKDFRGFGHRLPIYAAEGRAWRPIKMGDAYLTRDYFKDYLERARTGPREAMADIGVTLVRSPLLTKIGDDERRTGNVERKDMGRIVEDWEERASGAVVDFMGRNVRLHGDKVLFRVEWVIGMGHLHLSSPWLQPVYAPRESWRALLCARADRIDDLWDLHRRPNKGDVSDDVRAFSELIPGELMEDDDALVMASKVPAYLLQAAKQWKPPSWWSERPEAARLSDAIPRLRRMAEEFDCGYLAPSEVPAALDRLVQPLRDLEALHAAYQEEYPTVAERPALTLARMLRAGVEMHLDRVAPGPKSLPEDDEAIAALRI